MTDLRIVGFCKGNEVQKVRHIGDVIVLSPSARYWHRHNVRSRRTEPLKEAGLKDQKARFLFGIGSPKEQANLGDNGRYKEPLADEHNDPVDHCYSVPEGLPAAQPRSHAATQRRSYY